MPIIASAKSNKQYALPPAGNHVAICAYVCDLGTQVTDWKGETKESRKIIVGWELPNETHIFDEAKGAEPFVVSREYGLSLGEKANLRKTLESWRGRAFTAEELNGFDVSKLVGKPCMVNVIHVQSQKDPTKTFANVASVSGMPKGMPVPEAKIQQWFYSIDEKTGGQFNNIPDWMKKKIEASKEFVCPAPPPTAAPEPEAAVDEVPF